MKGIGRGEKNTTTIVCNVERLPIANNNRLLTIIFIGDIQEKKFERIYYLRPLQLIEPKADVLEMKNSSCYSNLIRYVRIHDHHQHQQQCASRSGKLLLSLVEAQLKLVVCRLPFPPHQEEPTTQQA
ncbi:unnamed protein product [Citrullus colocynthis]|uniref:Uncharacterized protein n=1 Tax=Citrullus colocynthis TaxID=252529 RepID=A0ABP0Y4P0_9ROSI